MFNPPELLPPILVCGLLALASMLPARDGDVLQPDVRALVPRLEALMRAGLHRQDPSANVLLRRQGASLFDGSYDWHSNVIAHWALLTMARTSGDEELASFVLAPLTPVALEAERARLRDLDERKLITYPYDQAWLLMLLAELERHRDPVPADLRAFRTEVEGRVLTWLEESKFPENDDPEGLGGNSFVGFYRSWLFAWYLVRTSEPLGEGALERLASLKQERIVPRVGEINDQANSFMFDFLWVPALIRLIHDVDPFSIELPAYNHGTLSELPEEVTLSTVHVLGVEISRLWPLAIAARGGDEGARTLFHRRWDELIARSDLWAEDFQVVTHWVPQFLWIAIWLADGRP